MANKIEQLSVKIAGKRYSVEIKRHQRAKHARLRFGKETDLQVTVPTRFRVQELPELMDYWQHWIEGHAEKLAARQQQTIQGIPAHLQLPAIQQQWQIHHASAIQNRLRCDFQQQQLILQTIEDTHGSELLREACKRIAKQSFPPLLTSLAEQMQLQPVGISIKLQKTRWGSCSSKGNINLNAALLFTTPATLRYVMIHELAHLQHLNHSPAFWALVSQFEPNWATYRRGLKSIALPHWLL